MEVPPLGASYSYDGIGNRLSSTSGVLGGYTYTANALNQYGTVTTGDTRTAVGRATTAVGTAVNVNGQPASRIGDIFYRPVTVSNASAGLNQHVVTALQPTGGVAQSFTRFWYAKATATPAYDLDGNLLSDARNTTSLAEEGRWVYTWDAENRLIQMETPASYTASGGFYTKLTFEYNWEGKRIARHLWTGGTPLSPTFVSSKRWLYDGWNPVAEFTATAPGTETGATAAALNRYTWGLDLGDTGEGIARPRQMLQRAGGVGGLLLQATVSGSVLEHPSCDGNGGIVAWAKSTATAPTVRREHDAFGNAVMSEGTNPSEFGFSAKLDDPRSSVVYYGYRNYQPERELWQSRI